MGKQNAVGYLYYKRYRDETDSLLIKRIERRMKIIPLILEKQYDIEDMTNKLKDCKLVINYAASEPVTFEAIELSKTFEEIGKRVINSSHSFFYQEDKWMFYLKCLENNLQTPKTHLIPKEGHNKRLITKYLNSGPLVLKAIFSDKGLCVEKADNYEDFEKKLSELTLRNPLSPILAQEFLLTEENQSIRVTLIGNKVVQSVVKYGKSWKQSGDEKEEKFKIFELDKTLINLCEKASRVFGMEICGLDLIKSKDNWYILEVNSCPHLGFIKSDRKRIMDSITDYVFKLNNY